MTQRTASLAMVLMSVLGVALGGCQTKDEPLPESVTSALENAFTRGDIDACVAVYTDDAEILPEDAAVVRGKAAITAFFKDQVERDISFDTDTSVSLAQGDLAIEQGTYRVRNVRSGVDVEYGEYLNVWRRTEGKWRAFRSMYNVTMSRDAGVSVSPDEDETPAPVPAPAAPTR
ncbi:MAG: nuclear transport factor 2 family protein [Gammaproteobacteria bacterium]